MEPHLQLLLMFSPFPAVKTYLFNLFNLCICQQLSTVSRVLFLGPERLQQMHKAVNSNVVNVLEKLCRSCLKPLIETPFLLDFINASCELKCDGTGVLL